MDGLFARTHDNIYDERKCYKCKIYTRASKKLREASLFPALQVVSYFRQLAAVELRLLDALPPLLPIVIEQA